MKIFSKPVKFLFVLQIASFSLAACADWGSGDSSNLSDIRENVSDIESFSRQSYYLIDNIDDTLSTKLLSIYETLYQYTQYVYSNPLWNSSNINTMVDGDNSYNNVNLGNGGHTLVQDQLLDDSIERVMPANMQYNNNGSWSILFNRVQDKTYNYLNFLGNIKQQIGGSVDDFIDSWNTSSHFVQIYNYNNEELNGVTVNQGAVSESDLALAQKNINKAIGIATNANIWFQNYQPDNDILFTLDFSSLGYALSRLTGTGNRWTDFQMEISLNPTEQRPLLKKVHDAWNSFYIGKKGFLMFDMCIVLITLLWIWNTFKSILQMD